MKESRTTISGIVTPKNLLARLKLTLPLLIFILLLVVTMPVLGIRYFLPIYYYESVFSFFIVFVVAMFSWILFLSKSGGFIIGIRNLASLIVPINFLFFFCISTLWALNGLFDFHEATTVDLPISGKAGVRCSHGRHPGYDYNGCVDFELPYKSPFFVTFMTVESVSLSQFDYRRVVPGKSTLTLTIHKGLFGWPWYERSYKFHP